MLLLSKLSVVTVGNDRRNERVDETKMQQRSDKKIERSTMNERDERQKFELCREP